MRKRGLELCLSIDILLNRLIFWVALILQLLERYKLFLVYPFESFLYHWSLILLQPLGLNGTCLSLPASLLDTRVARGILFGHYIEFIQIEVLQVSFL